MTRHSLHRDITALIGQWHAGAPIDPARVDALLIALFRHQFQHIAAYAAFCQLRGVRPNAVTDWRQIPLVPVSAFQLAALGTADAQTLPAATFHTSGTTTGRPGIVRLLDTTLYDRAAQAAFAHWVLPDRPQSMRVVALLPGPELRPFSSLGHMVAHIAAPFGGPQWLWHREDHPDVSAFITVCQNAVADQVPLLICATTLALAVLQAQLPADFAIALPPGSRLMDTGGPKGRTLTVDRPAQHAWLTRTLGLAADHLVGEFGMTELGSQRYEAVLRATVVGGEAADGYAGPPWLRSRVLAMKPGQPALDDCPTGVQGLVGHLDLANLDTCAFVQTADLGALDHAGHLTLHGRLPGSELRGCGLDAEELGLD